MKTAAAIALPFACLVLLLKVNASPVHADRSAPVPAPAAAIHVGEGENRPL